ncbi:MAG: flagellar hook-basal body complex protein FliE [Rickettsiales bacterium]|nr:flagellar hook-basal body complex protein FliE [Rickettsiales bacterium]
MNNLTAVNAYQNQMKLMQDAAAPASSNEQTSGSSFASLLEGATKDSANTLYNAEAMQMDSLVGGKVDLTDLVTAVANAELTLNTVVAIRDRVINAYQDIIKMPI